MRQGILCIFSGPPLSGKSTFIGGLKKQINSMVIISTDEIRFELSRDYQFRPEMESLVWELAYQRARAALSAGNVVAFDATLINPEYRGKLLLQFPKVPVLYFAFIKPDYYVIKERNEKRKWKQIDAGALKKMYNSEPMWVVAVVMALSNMVGAWLGARLAIKEGATFVRKVFLLAVFALIAKTAWDAFVR